MLELKVHTLETAPAGSRPILETLKSQVGFIPNLAATMGESPALIEAFVTLRGLLRRGTFTGPERETIALAISHANACSYCMAAHSTFADLEGAPDDAVAALRAGESPAEHPRLAALATVTRKIAAQRGFLSAEDVQEFLRAGFAPAQLLEVLVVMATTVLANHAHNLGNAPLDQAFRKRAWTAPGRGM